MQRQRGTDPSARYMARDVLILWTEGKWRCEIHTGRTPGEGSFLVYCGDVVVTAEAVPLGAAAYARADILRQRVLRGDLRAA
jgi:hypothetical protein